MLAIHLYYNWTETARKETFLNTEYLHMFSNTEDSFWALLVKCFPVKKMWVITWERCYMLKEQETHHTFNKEAEATCPVGSFFISLYGFNRTTA